MTPSSRRRFLQSGGVLCSLGFAGCIDVFRSKQQEARIGTVEFHNHTTDEQSILVIVENSDEEQVYGDFTAVPPADGESATVREVKGLPEAPGVYDIKFELARRPDRVEGEFWARAANTDVQCRAYRLTIEPDETGEPQFGIYRSAC